MHHPLFPPLPLFALREKDVCVCVCMRVKARIRLKRTRKKISFPSSHRERLFSLDDSWNTFTHVHYSLSLPKPTNLVFKIVFKFMRGTIPAPLLPTESLSVIGGTGARCLFAQLVVQTILLSPPPLFLPPVDIAFSAFRRN